MSETRSTEWRSWTTRRRIASIVLPLLAVVAWWFTLAPRDVGGPLSAVVVSGTSMQPRFHTGDVVIVHREPSYHIGDIVAVKVDGGEVIHQLVAGNAISGWRTKGINRTTMDGWVIPNKNVLGKQWIHVAGAATWTRWVRTPIGVGGVLAGICFLCAVVPTERRRSRHHRTREQAMKDAKRSIARDGNDAPLWKPSVPRPVEPALLAATALAGIVGASVTLTWWLPNSKVAIFTRPSLLVLIAITVIVVVVTALALYLTARVFRGFGGSYAEKVYAQLRERIVSVRAIVMSGTMVVVPSARELKRIAEINVAPIVHEVTPLGHRFAVIDQNVTYLLVVGDDALSQVPPTLDLAVAASRIGDRDEVSV